MSEQDELVRRLADLAGVATGFRDQTGQWIETPLPARRALLDGFGLTSETLDETRTSLFELDRLRRGLVAPLIVALADAPTPVAIRSVGDSANWRLTNEAGDVREGRAPVAEGQVLLPPLGTGYYTLVLMSEGATAEATILSAPARCYLPPDLESGARMWGAAAQVYGLRTPWSIGIGEFADIAEIASATGKAGGDFLGLSPLHALFAADRSKTSPYSPSSRLFLESLHINVTAVPEFGGSRAAALMDSAEFKEELAAVRALPLVDHEKSWTLKKRLLELLFSDVKARGGDLEFSAWRAQMGEPLERHATFDALSEHFLTERRFWPGEWPEDFKNPRSDVVAWFREEKAERVSFYAWLQYLADLQLFHASQIACESGMRIGLYRDLAVGPDRGGSEVWAQPDLFSPTLAVGAPPDPLGPQGQNWGLPPFDPFALERSGLKAFRALLGANMRHAGAIRIDHAFQLQRLFLIPEGGSGADGGYLHYPFEAMLAALRIESHRHKCIVIAEDLGTAPDGFSEAIMQAGLLSYRVMYFERGEHGRFKRPVEYPRDALSVHTTHDLPTLRGWWRGLDIDLRERLGIFPPERAHDERAGRRHDVEKFCEAVREEGLGDGPLPPEPPLAAAIRYVGRAPSALTAVQIEDLGGEVEQANLPGVEEGHPNWRRRLSLTVGDLAASEGPLVRCGALMREEGRGR